MVRCQENIYQIRPPDQFLVWHYLLLFSINPVARGTTKKHRTKPRTPDHPISGKWA